MKKGTINVDDNLVDFKLLFYFLDLRSVLWLVLNP